MIIFRNEIQKGGKDYEEVAERLLRLINQNEPRMVYFLVRTWKEQESSLTYKELREAIEGGAVTEGMMDKWRQSYSKLVADVMLPNWMSAIESAHDQFRERSNGLYDPGYDTMMKWTREHAANWVVDITKDQRLAINGLIQRATQLEFQTSDALARAIRPTIGLYPGQATANFNYYQRVRDTLLENNPNMRVKTAEKRAKDAAIKYGAKQHRYRAQMIARTEIAAAYNNSEHEAVKQAIKDRIMLPTTEKTWLDAGDNRRCEICKGLNGTSLPIGQLFTCGFQVPPAHPHCRCVVIYVEK